MAISGEIFFFIFAQLMAHFPYNHIRYGLQSFAVCDEKLMMGPI